MMDNSIEKQLKILELESAALKSSFSRSANELPLFTISEKFTTTRNAVNIVANGNSNISNDPERIVITLNTNIGANTIANLEISTNNSRLPVKRRVPYSGGAKWIVTAATKGDISGDNWQSTTYQFNIQSLVDGELTITEMSS